MVAEGGPLVGWNARYRRSLSADKTLVILRESIAVLSPGRVCVRGGAIPMSPRPLRPRPRRPRRPRPRLTAWLGSNSPVISLTPRSTPQCKPPQARLAPGSAAGVIHLRSPPSQWPLVVNRLFERVDRPRVDGHRNGERARVEVDLGLLEQLFIEQQRDPEQPTERRKLAEGSARSFRATGHAFRVAPRGRPAGSSRAEGPPAFAPAPPGSQTRARRGPCGAGRWPWLAPRNGCRAPRDSHRRRPPPRAR
jgi:hypothetical protein